MTIRDYLAIIRQRILIVAIVVLITTGSAMLLAIRQAPLYEGKSRLLVTPLPNFRSGAEVPTKWNFERGVATEAEIVKSVAVAERVIARLGLHEPPWGYTPERLIDSVEITPVIYTDVLEIRVLAPDPNLASDLANALPDEYVKLRRQEAVEIAKEGSDYLASSISKLLEQLAEIDAQLELADEESSRAEFLSRQRDQIVVEMASLESTRRVLIDQSPLKERGVGQIIEHATPSADRANGDLLRTGILGFIIGLPLGFGLALLLDATNDTVKSAGEAESAVGAETLGVIPLTPEWRQRDGHLIVAKEAPYSGAAEAYRTLRVNLESLRDGREINRILFTSPGTSEGKTTAVANLSVAFSDAGRSVMALSADLRRPKLHALFETEPGPGLAEVLRNEKRPDEVIHEPMPHLYLLPSGERSERPDRLFSGKDMNSVLDEVCVLPRPRGSRGDDERGSKTTNGKGATGAPKKASKVVPGTVLVDSPSVLGAAEVSALAPAVDGVVLVIQSGVTRREAAVRAAEQVRRAGGQILGVVLIGSRVHDDYSPYPQDQGDLQEPLGSAWSRVLSNLRG